MSERRRYRWQVRHSGLCCAVRAGTLCTGTAKAPRHRRREHVLPPALPSQQARSPTTHHPPTHPRPKRRADRRRRRWAAVESNRGSAARPLESRLQRGLPEVGDGSLCGLAAVWLHPDYRYRRPKRCAAARLTAGGTAGGQLCTAWQVGNFSCAVYLPRDEADMPHPQARTEPKLHAVARQGASGKPSREPCCCPHPASETGSRHRRCQSRGRRLWCRHCQWC